MEAIHGGDIYTNHVDMDFSVNVNPLGIPEAVEAALHKAVGSCSRYPDITAGRLKKAVAGMLHVPEEDLLFGNGASELFMAVVHGIRPRKTVIPVPSFYGYEYAVTASGGDVFYHVLKEEHAFCMDEAFFSVLTEEVDLLLLANPNNPTGALMSREYMQKLLDHCREKGICVVIDECFIEFCGEGTSVLPDIERFDNLILVRAFTKIFAIPGVRLGYLVCSSRPLLQKIKRQLPEWNLSGFAQAAGCECAAQTAYVRETAAYIKRERPFLAEGLERLGFTLFPGNANFLLLYSEDALYAPLLERGILIRDCGNFRGLSEGFYRIAVKRREENMALLKEIGEIR